MPRTLVIGYGNPLRGDDGLGWEVANRLAELATRRRRSGKRTIPIVHCSNPRSGSAFRGQERTELPQNLPKVLAVHQLTPELAEPISEADFVIFVDACYQGQPGSWKCETIQPGTSPQGFAHFCTPMSLLAYAKGVFNVCPKALLISAAASSFDYSDGLSPSLSAIVPEIVSWICEQSASPQME